MLQLLNRNTDRCLILGDRTWKQFKSIQKGFEGASGVRLFYYNNTIEILMPGTEHEFYKSIIGMLIELFFLEREIEFAPTGSKTQERQEIASVQADESYCIGDLKSIPDLSIEVVFSSGGIEKLPRYQALGVPEVWFWEDGIFALYHLANEGYERIYRSEIPELATLDFDLLTRCVLLAQTSRLAAAKEFCQGIQS